MTDKIAEFYLKYPLYFPCFFNYSIIFVIIQRFTIRIMRNTSIFSILFVSMFLFSCENNTTSLENAEKMPIIMGDSSLIVFEEDSQYLENVIVDIRHKEVQTLPSEEKEEEKTNDVPVIEKQFRPQIPNGFSIDFSELSLLFSGIETIEYMQQEPKKLDGVSYKINNGNILEESLYIQDVEKVEVRQRYLTELYLQNKNQELLIESAGKYKSEWEEIKELNENMDIYSFPIKVEKPLQFKTLNAQQQQNLVQRELRNKRYSRAATNEWMRLVRQNFNLQNKPYSIKLHALQWQIKGQTRDGKIFFKTVNMEL